MLQAIRSFFEETTHPVNLAIFRGVVFYQLMRRMRYTSLEAFGQLPASLRVAPDGYDNFFEFLPLSEPWTFPLRYITFGFCFLAFIGFRTRTSALIAGFLCLYSLGVAHCFGKIDHNRHHLIWFAFLLAASPCGHALSVDSLIARWRKRRGQKSSIPTELQPARVYALPLRIAWLLMAVIYFFPGVYKLVQGPEWFLSDSLMYVMYDKWIRAGQVASFRIDHFPWLCRLGGIATLVFELGFPFLVLLKRTRPLLLVMGVSFHLSTRVLLNIRYTELLVCYSSFVDWYGIGCRMGNWLGLTTIADRPSAEPLPTARRTETGLLVLGGFLIVTNVLCGITHFNSWPFSRFPKFDRIRPAPVAQLYEYTVVAESGDERVVKPTIWPGNLLSYDPPTESERQTRWGGLVEVMKINGLELVPGERLRVYRVSRSSVPEEWDLPPLERELIYEHTEGG